MKRSSVAFALALAALTACQSPPAPTITVVGLWPEDPPLRYKPSATKAGKYYDVPRLDSDRPTLCWEAFPRRADLLADTNGLLAQVKSVTYDLRIWQGTDFYPSALVYSRDALPATSHQVERPLARGVWYFWSIRARFEFSGGTRLTEWSRLESPPLTGIVLQPEGINFPDSRSYLFVIR